MEIIPALLQLANTNQSYCPTQCLDSLSFFLSPLLLAVEWSKKTLSDTCSGTVTHHAQSGSGFVSPDYWTKSTGDSFCKGLDCGNMKRMRPSLVCSADVNQQTNNISTIECQGLLYVSSGLSSINYIY